MPSLNQNTIERIPIALPPIQEQRRIAGILGALDDKIDLNRRMSQTLESMARALFKSWFIDFDPVRAKSEGLDTGLPDEIDNLFTDAVELSDWGEIPCGWQPTALGDLCERPQYGFTASATDQAVGPRFLRITDINKRPWIEWASVPYCEASETERRQYRVKPGDVLIARMADPGHGVMIEEDTGAVYASYLIRFRPIDHRYDRFLQYWLRSDDYWSLVDGYRTGTTRASLNAQVLSAFRLVLPPPALADAFGTQVSGLRSLLTRNVSESTILSEARDHLLARLMTGARTDRPKERVEGARL
jgi:type I restriction enzyme S subunit